MSSTRTTAAQADGPRSGPGLSDRAAGAAGPLIRIAPIPYTYTKIPHPAPFPRSPNRHASSPSVRRFRIRIRICCSVRGGAGEAHGRRRPAGRMPAGRPTAGCRRHGGCRDPGLTAAAPLGSLAPRIGVRQVPGRNWPPAAGRDRKRVADRRAEAGGNPCCARNRLSEVTKSDQPAGLTAAPWGAARPDQAECQRRVSGA